MCWPTRPGAYHRHEIAFPGGPVLLWTWDTTQKVPVPSTVSQSDVELYFGVRLSREALQLDPTDTSAQVALVSLALDKAIERVGFAAFPASDPTAAFSTALSAGPDVLGRVVRTALADRKYDLAAAAVSALGQVTDRGALATDRRPNPLVEALSAPSRRVQLAAARALVLLEPPAPFAGSSQVVPILARFVTTQSEPRAIVIDGNTPRGGQLAGFLRELGYDPIPALTGDDGFRLAVDSADVELILIDNHLVAGKWRVIDTLANLRADARTAGIPVYLVGPINLEVERKALLASFSGVKTLVTPPNSALLERQLGGRPSGLSDAERTAYAREAASLLASIAVRPGNPFLSDLSGAEPALAIALNTSSGTESAAATALAEVPVPDAQRGLADLVLDPSKPAPLRVEAGGRLVRSIQRFGPLIDDDQERRFLAVADQETDPALRTTMAAALGALRPRPEAVGHRVRQYGSLVNPDSNASANSSAPTTATPPEAPSPASETPGSVPPPAAPEGKP